MKLSHYDFIIGIDQVGAVNSKGSPKALPISIISIDENKRSTLFTKDQFDNPLELKSLSYKIINEVLINLFAVDISFCNVFIIVDAVLGLPTLINKEQCSSSRFIREHIQQSLSQPNWGLAAGQSFFDKVLICAGQEKSLPLLRKVEASLNANSVFKSTPFQKNIQTGTFRIWKDLANFPLSKVLIYPYDKVDSAKAHVLVAEGYPTTAWKALNKTSRTSTDFSYLKKNIKKVGNLDLIKEALTDQKDAIMLCLMAWKLLNDEYFPSPLDNKEGAILGYHSICEPSQDKN